MEIRRFQRVPHELVSRKGCGGAAGSGQLTDVGVFTDAHQQRLI